MSEKPGTSRPRRLRDWLNPTCARKVHSLVDKVYKPKNLLLAWEKVRRNKGAGGVDGETLEEFEEGLQERLERLHAELKTDTYRPQPVRQKLIPKSGQPGKYRPLGIPAIYDHVCQQALLNRLEPIFEPVFDDANFGYRRGRSAKDAMGILQGPCPRTLQSSRPLDSSAALVLSIQAMALPGIPRTSRKQVVRRDGTCEFGPSDSIPGIAMMSLCESRMREICTSGLSGGRRPALRRASSDPTPRKLPNKDGGNPSAEAAEGRGSTKRNTRQSAAVRTQSRTCASNGLASVREAEARFYAKHPR